MGLHDVLGQCLSAQLTVKLNVVDCVTLLDTVTG